MAINPDLLVIKPVNQLESVTGLQAGELLFYDGSNNLKKIDIDTFNNLPKSAKLLKLSDPTPTEEGLYMPEKVGTYANAGGLTAQDGYYTLFFFDGTNWSKSETLLPQNNVKIPKWEDLTFPVTGYLQTVHQSSIYELPPGVTAQSGDVPGVSDKWINISVDKQVVSALKNYGLISGVEESLKGYYNRHTGVFTPSSSYISKKFDIQSNVEYWATNKIQGTTSALAVFFGATDNYLGFQQQGVNGVVTDLKRVKLIIPAGTTKIGMSGVSSIGVLEKKVGELDPALKGGFNGTLKDLDNIKADSAGLFRLDVIAPDVVEATDGYYSKNGGNLNAYNGYKSVKVNAVDGVKYYVTSNVTGNSSAMAVYVDASDVWLGSQNASVSGTTSYKREKLILPTGTKTILLSSYGVAPTVFTESTALDIPVKGGFNGSLKDLDDKKADRSEIGLITAMTASGDSVVTGSGSTSGQFSWANVLASKLGATLTKVSSPGDSIWLNLLNQINNIPTNQNLITLSIGVNDVTKILNSEIVLGNINEVLQLTNANPTDSVASIMYNHSVLGRFRWCLEYARNKFPSAKIAVIAPIGANRPNYEPIMEELRNGQEKIAYLVNVRFIRPTSNPLFTVANFTAPVYLSDSLHPTDLGYKLLGALIFNEVFNI